MRDDREGVRIDELGIFDAYDAVESDAGQIMCPNGCYEPYKLTWEHLRAAAELPQCDECDAFHRITWSASDNDGDDDGTADPYPRQSSPIEIDTTSEGRSLAEMNADDIDFGEPNNS